MPELPDVEIFKQYFDATSLHRKITEVVACDTRLLAGISRKKLGRRLTGRSFSETVRHGKYLFARFEDRGFLVLHFGMTGFLKLFKEEREAPDHLGLLLRFADGYHLAFVCKRRLGMIAIRESVEDLVNEKELGPDALELCGDSARFAELLGGHRGSLKGLLMNQGVLAGIGNIYADEILFLIGWHPKRKAADLTGKELRQLAAKTRHILKTAIERRVGAEGWPKSWLLPRREAGRSCPRCSGTIRRITVSGRGTYYCPDHQA